MLESVVTVFVHALFVYLGLGVLFALPFVVLLVGRLDPLAKEGSLGFRILIFPGTVALWPLLATRLVRGTIPREHNAHRDAAKEGRS